MNKQRGVEDDVHIDSNKEKRNGLVPVQKGITLVSLVITIIILLILAGITLGWILGKNGIIGMAENAGKNYLKAEQEENNSLEELYSLMSIATNDNAQVNINVKQLLDIMYPVGSIYISTSQVNPQELFGGEWESYGEGRTLIGAGEGTDNNSISKTFVANTSGGEYVHTLTTNEMPTHSHTKGTMNITGKFISRGTVEGSYGAIGGVEGAFSQKEVLNTNLNRVAVNTGSHPYLEINFDAASAWTGDTSKEGNSEGHNNVQPYIVTYMWHRIK